GASLGKLGVESRNSERLAPALIIAHVVPPARPDVSAGGYQLTLRQAAGPVAREEQPVPVVGQLGLTVRPRHLALRSRVRVDVEAFGRFPFGVDMLAPCDPDIEVEHGVIRAAWAIRREVQRAPLPCQLRSALVKLRVD